MIAGVCAFTALLPAVGAPVNRLVAYPTPETISASRRGRPADIGRSVPEYLVKVDAVRDSNHRPENSLIAYFDFSGTAEISIAFNRGLYVEMVCNRWFEDNLGLVAWTPLTNAQAVAAFTLDQSARPGTNDRTSLRIQVEKNVGDRGGIFNLGFKGIVAMRKAPEISAAWLRQFAAAQRSPDNGLGVVPGRKYRFIISARACDFSGALAVSLETQSGEVLAGQPIRAFGTELSADSLTAENSFEQPNRISSKARVLPAFGKRCVFCNCNCLVR